jgi:hypothetical protein
MEKPHLDYPPSRIIEEIPHERAVLAVELQQSTTFVELLDKLGAYDNGVGNETVIINFSDNKKLLISKTAVSNFCKELWHAINSSNSQDELIAKARAILPAVLLDVLSNDHLISFCQKAFEVDGDKLTEQINEVKTLADFEKLFSLRKGIRNKNDEILSDRAIIAIIMELEHGQHEDLLRELPQTCGLRSKVQSLLKQK